MSIADVAIRAGVSQATVSRVINDNNTVSQDMANRVRQAIRELHYQPTLRRRRHPATREPVAVLIVHQNQFHHYTSSCSFMLLGVEQALRDRQMDMILAHVGDADDLPQAVLSKQVSGLILIGHQPSQEVLSALEDIPTVWLTSHHDVSGDMLLSGNETVGRLAAEYLIEKGHKTLGVLNTLGPNPVVDLRCQYFTFVSESRGCTVRQYVSDRDAMFRETTKLDLDLFERQVAEQVTRMLADEQRPTGLFVPMDLQVAMVYRLLDKHGVKPGKQLQIVGTDDEKGALIGLNPRPATVNIGPVTMGRHAVEQLFRRVDHHEERRVRVTVEPQLIPGD
ncbi:MAG: LacI family DNA-binding transcriptional regulator [Phycisphaeraceae bacterium]|nr:LacI family DNA-binding transcriptional regulator [Phycisphaeraceae bacterium]